VIPRYPDFMDICIGGVSSLPVYTTFEGGTSSCFTTFEDGTSSCFTTYED
jgi:hypothetical protein